jgi:hypothetical protein
MACTFFRAMGLETGKSLVEARSRRHGDAGCSKRGGPAKLVLPDDRASSRPS